MQARLSGEQAEAQFMADALLTRAAPPDRAPEANDCPKPQRQPPAATRLKPFVDVAASGERLQQFTATSEHSPNLGFAVWYPPGQPFLNANTYEQIFNPNGKPADNPGQTDVAGTKTVTWPYQSTAVRNLKPNATGRFVVLAIGCHAINVPASSDTAAVAVYQVTAGGAPRLIKGQLPWELNTDRLARTACQALL